MCEDVSIFFVISLSADLDDILFNMNSKEFFISKIIEERNTYAGHSVVRILELGCGTAEYIPAILDMHKNIEYVGIEPIGTSFVKASETLKGRKNAKLYFQLGYKNVEGLEEASFDIVFSLSALEHVKNPKAFIALGAKYAKQGGLIVHRYDLGHALYPSTLKERIHVFLGNKLPSLLPERKFVRYIGRDEVERLFETLHGERPYKYTNHQMPNHKILAKYATKEVEKTALEALDMWEYDYGCCFNDIEIDVLEKLFPTTAVWGIKA